MARKARDYKAEYQRRQELARARGHRSYGQQRYRIEHGTAPAIDINRVRSKRTWEAQQLIDVADIEKWFEKPQRRTRAQKQREARDYSKTFARNPIATFSPQGARFVGVTPDEYVDTYLEAFVDGNMDAKRRWFVEWYEYMETGEFDGRYGDNT